jgi:hypothetical protein
MASTGTRLRLASNSPLIRCRLPGPQLPAHTASSPVSAASPAAANAAASSCRTCSQVISPSRRSASVNPFSESPGIPYTRRTPDAFSVATMTSATVAVIVGSFRLSMFRMISALRHDACYRARLPSPADLPHAPRAGAGQTGTRAGRVGPLRPLFPARFGSCAGSPRRGVPWSSGVIAEVEVKWLVSSVRVPHGARVNSTMVHVAPYFVPAGGQCAYRSAGGPACRSAG